MDSIDYVEEKSGTDGVDEETKTNILRSVVQDGW